MQVVLADVLVPQELVIGRMAIHVDLDEGETVLVFNATTAEADVRGNLWMRLPEPTLDPSQCLIAPSACRRLRRSQVQRLVLLDLSFLVNVLAGGVRIRRRGTHPPPSGSRPSEHHLSKALE